MSKKRNTYQKTNQRVLRIMIFFGVIVALVISNVLFTMITKEHFRSGKNISEYSKDSNYVTENIVASRGHIYDRNKEIIAQDIDAYDLIAITAEDRVNASDKAVHVVDIDKTCELLAPILGAEAEVLKPFLENAKKNKLYQTEFGSYAKILNAQQKVDIEALKLPGLEFVKSTDRVYPIGDFASQLIGYAQYNYDDEKVKGVMGIESIFDQDLSGKDGKLGYLKDADGDYLPKSKKYLETMENGKDVYLTLDKDVQMTLEKALKNTMESNDAKLAWAAVMEVDSGRVLAQAGYPSFDLNNREKIDNFNNLPSSWSFEPGSVMKPFVYAAAMEEGVYHPEATFPSKLTNIGLDGSGNLAVVPPNAANYLMTVNDAEGRDYGIINYEEGLIRSTNTAIANMFINYLDVNKNIDYLKKFGFFKNVGLKGMVEDKGLLNTGSVNDKISLGFGQASRVTTYQLLQAYSALFTDGRTVTPYVVDKIVNTNTGDVEYQGKTKRSKPVVSSEVAKKVQDLMKKVVSEPYGTAHSYQMDDITMMAKTGTGEIYDDEIKGYSRSLFTSSIMAAAPADNPKIMIYYAFQSTNITNYSREYFKDVMREALLAVDGYANGNNQPNSDVTQASFNIFKMPGVINHTLKYAQDKLSAYTDKIVVLGDGNSIISQYPSSQSETISSQKVFLLSDGNNITMPNMTGWTRKDVQLFAKLSGMKVSVSGSGNVKTQSVNEKTILNEEMKIEVKLE